MNLSWKEWRVEDLAERVAMGPFGSSIRVDTFVPDGVPVISGRHLHRARLVEDEFNYVTPEHADRLKNSNAYRGDVVFTHAGNIGQVAVIPEASRFPRYVLSQRQFKLTPRTDIADPQFLAYYFTSPKGRHQLLANASSTGVPSIARPVSYLRSLKVLLPPIEEQRAIASVLGALDDKIELDRRMSETLEALARAIFTSWFVDFDPVRAKAEGRPPVGMDAETAALFPDSFEDSPLGPIPSGWRATPIGEVVTVVGGSTPRTGEPSFWGGSLPFATPKDLAGLQEPLLVATGRSVTPKGAEQVSSGVLPRGTVLLSSRAPIGYLAISEVPVVVNQGFIAMRCEGPLSNYYVLNWARHNMDRIVANANGTTFLEISKTNFRPIPVIVPTDEVLRSYGAAVAPLYDRITSNIHEARILNDFRDRLLPKLVSGEIRVPID